MKEHNNQEEVVEEKTIDPIDNFFTAKDSGKQIKDFLKHMKTPVEQIEAPPIMMDQEEEIDNPEITNEEIDPEDRDAISYLDYSEEHKLTAEFILVQLDKVLAFSFSMISGAEMDRYRRRKEKPNGTDYEAEIGAALVKKYQMRLSLEWMMASALVMGYAPMMNKAFADRRKAKAEEARERARQQATMINPLDHA